MFVTCGRSVAFSGYSGILHQKEWPPRYNWNIALNTIAHTPIWSCTWFQLNTFRRVHYHYKFISLFICALFWGILYVLHNSSFITAFGQWMAYQLYLNCELNLLLDRKRQFLFLVKNILENILYVFFFSLLIVRSLPLHSTTAITMQ